MAEDFNSYKAWENHLNCIKLIQSYQFIPVISLKNPFLQNCIIVTHYKRMLLKITPPFCLTGTIIVAVI